MFRFAQILFNVSSKLEQVIFKNLHITMGVVRGATGEIGGATKLIASLEKSIVLKKYTVFILFILRKSYEVLLMYLSLKIILLLPKFVNSTKKLVDWSLIGLPKLKPCGG